MKKQKIKSSFLSSAKARVVIAAVVVVGVATAGVMMWQAGVKRNALQGQMKVSNAPMIDSVPGAGNPTTEYVKKQDRENFNNAVRAREEATSSVPTINRGSFVGSLDTFGQSQPMAQCPLDPRTLPAPDPKSCTVDSLQRARESGVRALELRCKGCACPALKMAGYTLGDLKDSGFDAKAMKECGFSLAELKAAGFSAADLKAAGFTAAELKAAGFSAAELKAAGFTAKELKDAGFSAKELKDAGFSAKDLKDAGFNAGELAAAGFSANELKSAGFTDADLQRAGINTPQTDSKDKACSLEELKKAREAGMSAQALKARGCGLAALKAAGYTAAELRAAGFSAKDLKDAGFSAKELKDAGFSAKDLKDAGFSAAALKAAGFSAAELKDAGFSAGQLKDAGFSAAELRKAGFSDAALRDAGFSAEDLKNAGATPSDLALAGFTKGDLLRAGYTPTEAGYAANAPAKDAPAETSADKTSTADSIRELMPKPTNSPSDQLAELERQQRLRMNQQQRQDMIMQQQAGMSAQAARLMVGWSNFNQQSDQAALPQTSGAAGGPGMAGGIPGSSGASAVNGDMVKAGDIMFAVLDSAINSDERGTPVMARVVGGPYKGGKLIGKFSLVDKRLLLTFNLLNLPDRSKTVAINAVAIDPETARTAMSGEVDNHYLLRYGTLFASSFISGVGSALQASGTTTENTTFGTVVISKSLSPAQLAVVGAGQAGSKIGQALAPTFNMPPTVTIQAGVGMGLLFMSDVTIPAADK